MAYTFFKARGRAGRQVAGRGRPARRARATSSARAQGAAPAAASCRSITSSRRSSRPARRRRRSPSATRRSAIGWASTSARETVEDLREVLAAAKTVVWNGPMGVFEIDAFAKGTIEVAQGRGGREGHDRHRRRRLDCRRRQGRRHRSRSRTSRPAAARRWSSSAGADAARRRRPLNSRSQRSRHDMRTPFIAAQLEDVQDRPRGGRVRQGVPQPREGHRTTSRSSSRRRSPRSTRWPKRRASSNVGVAGQNLHWEREGAFTGEVSAGDAEGGGRRVRDHRPLGAPAAVRRNRPDA